MIHKCTRCGSEFDTQQAAEWILGHKPFSMKPFICPDCFDRLVLLDIKDQIKELIKEAEENTQKEA